jgi:heme-degrading monooxygenase HmoA
MEKQNAPLISLNFNNRMPGADAEVFERYTRWTTEVYMPLQMKFPTLKGIDYYRAVKESLDYPIIGYIYHWPSLKAWETFTDSPEGTAVRQETVVWIKRGVRDPIWSVVYELVRSFRSGSTSAIGQPDTLIENAPVMSLEAFRLSPEDEEKYVSWFTEYGCSSFVPLFLRLPGFKGYDWYKYTGPGRQSQNAREQEYPSYVSLIYFENTRAFDNFVKSPELASFLKVMRSVFAHGLGYEWYVQYQLIKSVRNTSCL